MGTGQIENHCFKIVRSPVRSSVCVVWTHETAVRTVSCWTCNHRALLVILSHAARRRLEYYTRSVRLRSFLPALDHHVLGFLHMTHGPLECLKSEWMNGCLRKRMDEWMDIDGAKRSSVCSPRDSVLGRSHC